ncbi:Protein of unknown function [Gryllus bimaculatus]|nr:Protein of unknown function [Gryllus bimaculatus]
MQNVFILRMVKYSSVLKYIGFVYLKFHEKKCQFPVCTCRRYNNFLLRLVNLIQICLVSECFIKLSHAITSLFTSNIFMYIISLNIF